jgi:hypothetical protein
VTANYPPGRAITLAEIQAARGRSTDTMSTTSSLRSSDICRDESPVEDEVPPQFSGRQAGRSCKKPIGFFVGDDAAYRQQITALNGDRRRATKPSIQKRPVTASAAPPANKARKKVKSPERATNSNRRRPFGSAARRIGHVRASLSQPASRFPSTVEGSSSDDDDNAAADDDDDEVASPEEIAADEAASRAFMARAAAVGTESKKAWLAFVQS